MNSVLPSNSVLELPGLYGPFTFPEKLLQKIWLRREFDSSRALTTDGRPITITHPGKWNLLGGPDFKNARIKLGDQPEITGDIELHLHAADWAAHRHAYDPAYNGVILHVVLFSPGPNHTTRSAFGATLPVLVLLPLLLHDLEEYAAEDAVEQLANRPATQIVEVLGQLPLEELRTRLRNKAEARWCQKVRYARMRVERLGWEEACHQTALEILGYRFNRAAMLRMASAFPLRNWIAGNADLERVYESGRPWSLQGLRPANHPRIRLRQYAHWTESRPDWPARLLQVGATLPHILVPEQTRHVRRSHGLPGLRRAWNEEITDGAVSGTRFDNLMCDGFLPLIAAQQMAFASELWHHWYTGDVPPLWGQALRQLEVFGARNNPASHGVIQGLLGWLIERERSTPVSTGRSA